MYKVSYKLTNMYEYTCIQTNTIVIKLSLLKSIVANFQIVFTHNAMKNVLIILKEFRETHVYKFDTLRLYK